MYIFTLFCLTSLSSFQLLTALPSFRSPRASGTLEKRTLGGTQITGCSLDMSQLPKLGSEPRLPDPSAGLKLKYATLGRGTQNYTCSGDSQDAPKPNGAVAILCKSYRLSDNSRDQGYFKTSEIPAPTILFNPITDANPIRRCLLSGSLSFISPS